MEVRPIDGNVLKQAIVVDFYEHYTNYHDSDQKALIEMILDDIDEMPTLTPPNEWVSVDDGLPESGTVLVTDGQVVITAPASSVTRDGPAITHWMPLPEPPDRRPPEGGDADHA